MLRELITILRSSDPLRAMRDNFARMLQITYEMTLAAGDIYFGKTATPEGRTRLYEQDVEVNQLERTIRKQVVAHLSFPGNVPDMPHCLLLMSLVKDVERLGDYAKNLSEVVDIWPEKLPDDEVKQELLEVRRGVEEAFQSTAEVFEASDQERALVLIRQGRDIAHRCETLLQRIASGSCEAGVTVAQVLGTRYYKRIGGHVLNVLSSVVMPLHKVDYYDEDEIHKGSSDEPESDED
jgi:phosphate transport system protein